MEDGFVEVNSNNWVKVKLTPLGENLLRMEHHNLYERIRESAPDVEIPPFKLNLDEEGYYTTQLWTFMNTFGPYTNVGREPLFDNELLIKKNT